MHEYYVTPEDYETGKRNGISYNNVYQRVYRYNWSIKDAITVPVQKRRKYTIEEKQIIKTSGIPLQTVQARVRRGWSFEKAVSCKMVEVKYFPKRSRTKYTDEMIERARANGICYNTFINRVVVAGWDIEKAITTPPRKKR